MRNNLRKFSLQIPSHLIRCFKSQKINACLKHSLGQLEQADIGFLLCLVLLAENLGLVIEAVECIGYFVNISADLVRCLPA